MGDTADHIGDRLDGPGQVGVVQGEAICGRRRVAAPGVGDRAEVGQLAAALIEAGNQRAALGLVLAQQALLHHLADVVVAELDLVGEALVDLGVLLLLDIGAERLHVAVRGDGDPDAAAAMGGRRLDQRLHLHDPLGAVAAAPYPLAQLVQLEQQLVALAVGVAGLAPGEQAADQVGGGDPTLQVGGVAGAGDLVGGLERRGQGIGGGLIQRGGVEGGVVHDLLPLHAGEGLGAGAEDSRFPLAVDLALHHPGERPVVGEAGVAGEQLEGDQRQSVLLRGQLRVQVAADHRGAQRALADGEEALQIGPIGAIAGQPVEEQVLDALGAEVAALQQGAEHLHQQGLAGAEEAADPDAHALLVVAVGGVRVGVQHLTQEALPGLGDHQAVQLGGDDGRLAVEHLDHRLDPLGDRGGEKIADLHYNSSPR